MTHPKVQQAPPGVRRADELLVGDRIAADFLPTGEPATVLYLLPYELERQRWILVVYRFDGGAPDVSFFAGHGQILVEPRRADPHEGRTTAVAEAKPDTLVQPLGRAARTHADDCPCVVCSLWESR